MALEPDKLRDQLAARLEERRGDIAKLRRYYGGQHPFPTAPDAKNEAYKRLASLARSNLVGLVVDAVSERLEVTGIALGDGADREAADDIWRDVWTANDLDSWSTAVHDDALICRRSFVLVWPDAHGVTITPELPEEVVVAREAGARRRPLAALKEFAEGGWRFRVLWTPETVHYWAVKGEGSRWEPWAEGGGLEEAFLVDPDDFLGLDLELEEDGVVWAQSRELGAVTRNPLGRVPVVEFLARPDAAGRPQGELTPGALAIQDRINKTILDRLVAAEFLAFPQRAVIGLDPEDAEGKPRELKSGPERVWLFGDGNVSLEQLDGADLKPYLEAEASDVQAMAATTKTPVYYLASSFSNVGRDTIVAVDAGLVSKVRRHQRVFGDAWAEVVRLALHAIGDERAGDAGLHVEWADPEVHTLAELGDWASKTAGLLPVEDVWRTLGASSHEIERMRAADRTAGQDAPASPPSAPPAA